MNKVLFNQLVYFIRVNIPKYIEVKIQLTALKHLELPDMGKLRDRMEGQFYFNKLRMDIFSEYAFENVIGKRGFDWEKRSKKNYKRNKYIFENKKLNIIPFVNNNFPKFSSEHVDNCIFIYVNSDSRVFVSGLATRSLIKKETKIQKSSIIEFLDFKNLIKFKSIDDLVKNME